MADYEALLNAEKKKHSPSPTSAPEVQSMPEKADQSKRQAINQSTSQSTRQSIKRLMKHPTIQSDNKIVDKPKGFYITQRLDKKLDEAVRYLQEVHGIKKADRSTRCHLE